MPSHDAATKLGHHAVETRDSELSEDVRSQLQRHLLDFLGVSLGARVHAESTPAFERAIAILAGSGSGRASGGGSGRDGEATLLTDGSRGPAEHAALANGALAHSLDFDDTHRASSLHPGAPVIPAALAIAERENASTDELLRAISAGYDVSCTVGEAINPDSHYDRGFHVTATCGTFGATAAAGVLTGLGSEEIESAFGVNASQAAGSLGFLENGAWNKRLHPGLAARRAVLACALADAGFRGAARPFEGEHGFLQGYSDDPSPKEFEAVGEPPAVTETALKPYPCCRYMHPALDGLREIAADVDPGETDSITVSLPKPGVTLTGDPIARKRRPENFVDCQFSMPFGAALALTEGEADLPAFLAAQDRLDDPDLQELMDATEVVTTEEISQYFPEQWAARVVIETRGESSQDHDRLVETARGEPEDPLGWDGVVEKFETTVSSAGVSTADAEGIVAVLGDLETKEIGDLTDAIERALAPTARH
ncbi:MmgE/PrpD family protein [Halobacteriales archaeon QS_3_64_16]|nr:MAG: MmgE/PrpD family protein [Halobacteriales archaeon QS_3_64_16]